MDISTMPVAGQVALGLLVLAGMPIFLGLAWLAMQAAEGNVLHRFNAWAKQGWFTWGADAEPSSRNHPPHPTPSPPIVVTTLGARRLPPSGGS